MRHISIFAAMITIIFLLLTGCQNESSETLDGGDLNESTNEKQEKEEIDVDSDRDEDSQEEDQAEKDSSQDEEDQSSSNEESDNNEQTNDEQTNSDQSNNNESNDEQTNNEQSNNENQSQGDDSNVTVVSNPSAIDVVVNKRRKLPDGYTPPNLTEPNVRFSFDEQNMKRNMRQVAANALEELFAGANEAGVDLFAVSGYRSYDRQVSVFNYHVKDKGEEQARKVSAVPGHSEHQTGLAMDVSSPAVGYQLTTDFESTAEGAWVAENAHRYGFVVRYPKGKSHITGYTFEPWHLRYFGKDLATKVYQSGVTVEEYLGLVE